MPLCREVLTGLVQRELLMASSGLIGWLLPLFVVLLVIAALLARTMAALFRLLVGAVKGAAISPNGFAFPELGYADRRIPEGDS